ncbi:helix-turn-helix transcriptional regulator [Eggerthella sp. NSJ-70]|uniref:Helix-turn-helix transcriptional regulator n=2 Tax=Eggerthella hominis TaxID=2763043 RepID=A0ABR7BXF9_9ACTN|nr:helix-turn-helix transcriptional regulator [Eggerthella hominis]
MEIVFYVYTVLVMLVCIAASTIAISTFLISQNRTYLFTVFFFLFYFFDLVLIFQSEYLNHGTLIPLDSYYGIEQPLLKTVFAVGILESIWLIVCDYLNKRSLVLKIAPATAFVVASFLIVMLMPEGDWKQWCFYSLREAFFVWCLAYSFAQYRRTGSAVEHARLCRQRPLFIATAVLVVCIVVENTLLILIWTPSGAIAASLLPLYLSERNFSENTLVLVYAFFALRTGIRTLHLRAKEPPTPDSPASQIHIEDVLPLYAEQHRLTPRERDILRLTLLGKDYQNIASELQLAVGTVKSHTHNILKKTDQASRRELMQDFWKE